MIRYTNKFLSMILIVMILLSTGFNQMPVVTAASLTAQKAEGTIPPIEEILPPPVVTILEPTASIQQLPPPVEQTPEPTALPIEVPTELPPDPTATTSAPEGPGTGVELPTATPEPTPTPIPEIPNTPTLESVFIKGKPNPLTPQPIPTDVAETIVPPKPTKMAQPTKEDEIVPFDPANQILKIIIPVVPAMTYKFYVGTTLVDTQIIKNGESLIAPSTPAVGNCQVFDGWIAVGATTFIVFNAPITVTTTQNVNVNAVFSAICYVYFVYNGNVITTKEVAPGGTTDGNNVALVVKESEKVFGYWSETTTGSAFNFSTAIVNNLTLYAVLIDAWKVTFNTLGGSTQLPVYITNDNTLASKSVPNPTKVGYTFSYWSISQGGVEYSDSSPVTADLSLYAVWTPNSGTKYTVITWQENADDSAYSYKESLSKTGTTDASAESFTNPSYSGFTPDHRDPATATIAGDGSTIVNVYYKRVTYTLTMYTLNSSNVQTLVLPAVTIKNGASTAHWWDPITSTRPTLNWSEQSNGTGPWYSFAPVINGSNLVIYGKSQGTTKYAIYYLENVPGNPAIHVPFTFTGLGNLHTTIEDYVSFPGFQVIQPISGWDETPVLNNTTQTYEWKFYYNRLSYTISFNKNDGTGTDTTSPILYQVDISNKALAGYAVNSTLKTIDGVQYLFAGWFDNQALEGNPYDFAGKKMPANNLILYGKWVPPTHTVTVHVLPGEGSATQSFEVAHNATFAEASATGVRQTPTGLATTDFLGWFWYTNGTFAAFDFLMPITTDNVKLYPVWKDKIYTVNYIVSPGTGSVSDSSTYTFSSSASVLPATGVTPPTGQVFLGWKDTANTLYTAGDSLLITGNMTLTAVYGLVNTPTKITYNANGGTGGPYVVNDLANNATHVLLALSTTGFTRTDHEFTGWSTAAACSSTLYQAGDTVMVDRIDESTNIIYACWVHKPILTLAKTVNNDNGGTAVATDWTLSAACTTNTYCEATPLSGLGGGTGTVAAGVYTLSESGPDGYTPGSWVCDGETLTGDTVTVANGATVSCTITNTAQAASLTLVKVLTDNYSGPMAIDEWTLSATKTGNTTADLSGVGGTTISSSTLSAGTYALAEDPATTPGYTASAWDCGDKAVTNGAVTLANGDDVTCTITNTTQPATLSLEKDVINGAAVATDWTLSAAGLTTISGVTGATTVTNAPVSAGEYTLSEVGPENYMASAWICALTEIPMQNALAGSSIEEVVVTDNQVSLLNGQDVTCTITNTYVPPMDAAFTAIKVWEGGYSTDHIAVQLTLWRQIEGGPIEEVSGVTPSITPDPGTIQTNNTYTYNWTDLLATDAQGNPYNYYATEAMYKNYLRQYNSSITDEGIEYCAAVESYDCIITNIAPNQASSTLLGTKVWKDGPTTKPAVWLQLMQSENGGAAQPYLTPVMLDGTADSGCTSGCEKLAWQAIWLNVPTTDNMQKTWTYHVKEVDSSGAEWHPINYSKSESGMTVTNTYAPLNLFDPLVAIKVWANFSGPYPTIWMHLYRQIPGGNPQTVGSPVPLDGIKGGECSTGCEIEAWQARWDGLKAADLQGNVYVYFVKETDASGQDWVPGNFRKTEIGMTVTNTYVPQLSPTPIITIPKTGGSRGDMTGYGVFTLITLMAFAGLQILAARKKKS